MSRQLFAASICGLLILTGCGNGAPAEMSDELFNAFNEKDAAKIKRLIDADERQIGVRRNNRGDMPLHFAAADIPEVVDYLIAKKADVNARGYLGASPLHCAAHNGQVAALKALLAASASIDARDDAGFSPLQDAVMNGQMEAAAVLLDKGADPVAVETSNNRDVAELALGRQSNPSTFALVWSKLNAEQKKTSGGRLLVVAARNGRRDILEYILKEGVLIDSPAIGRANQTALIAAAKEHDVEILKFLIEKRANVAASDEDGKTALHWAVWFGAIENARILLENKTPVDAPDKFGDTALHYLTGGGMAEPTAFAFAELLLKHGANINTTNTVRGDTPRHNAAYKGRKQFMDFLSKHGADVSIRNKEGKTADEYIEKK